LKGNTNKEAPKRKHQIRNPKHQGSTGEAPNPKHETINH
jgi:hypothetical protein